MKTLADYIEPGLEILSVGLNPSPASVDTGIYFAGKQNRFWKALFGSELVNEVLPRGSNSMLRLMHEYKIGFTDTVKRPTSGAKDLRRADFVRDVPVLQKKIIQNQPAIVWFHGKVAYKQYLSVLKNKTADIEWGLQSLEIDSSTIFVTPNPSPANAVFSLDDLIGWYSELKQLRDQLRIY